MALRAVSPYFAGGASGAASAITVNNAANRLTGANIQADIDQTAGPITYRSSSYPFNGDGVTDNFTTAFSPLFAAAEVDAAAGRIVTILMQEASNGAHFASSQPLALSGQINITWGPVTLYTIGSIATRTRGAGFTHGTVGARSFGWCRDFKALNQITHQYLDGQYVGLVLINKHGLVADTWGPIEGFTYGVRHLGDGADNAFNNYNVGEIRATKYGINLRSRNGGSVISAENKFFGGDYETTTAMNSFGNTFAVVFDRAFDTDYANNSGDYFDGICVQNSQTPAAYTGTLVSGLKYLVSSISGIYLCKTGGATSGTKPTTATAPTLLTSITTVAGSNRVVVSATAGLSTGSHWRFWNPLDCFPDDTYISVFDGTHLDLFAADGTTPRNAFEASTTGKAYVTPTITDGSAVVVYFEPYCAQSVWLRDVSTSNFMKPSRCEGGFGGVASVTGQWMWPETTSAARKLAIEAHTFSHTQGNRINPLFPRWTANATYALADKVLRGTFTTHFWRCVKAGQAGATEPVITDATGLAFADNLANWICVPIQQSNSSADFEVFCNGQQVIQATVKSALVQPTQTINAPPLNLALAGADGWYAPGWEHCTAGSPQTNVLPLASYAMHTDGLILLSTTDYIAFRLRTDSQKYFEIDKIFCPGYTTMLMSIIPLDQYGNRITVSANANVYAPDVLGNYATNGAGTWSEPNGSVGPINYLWVSGQVYSVIIMFTGSGDSALAGCAVKVLPSRADALTGVPDYGLQNYSLQAQAFGARASPGIPTNGWAKQPGELIQNASAKTGATDPAYFIIAGSSKAVAMTTGAIAPAWVTSTQYRRGQMVTDSGTVYAANCKFISGTAPHLCTDFPAASLQNLLDTTATSVQSGFAATWTKVGTTVAIQSAANLT